MSTHSVDSVTFDCLAFEPTHLPDAVALSQQAQWPHRLADWALALSLSQGVVAVAAPGPDGARRVVGTALMTPYGDGAATINMVIVDESMRGRGLGRRLMDDVMALAGARPLRLIATREGLPLYEKLGFREVGTVVQHQGPVVSVPQPGAEDVALADPAEQPALIATSLTALDRQAFGADRSTLFARFAEVARFALLRRNGAVVGFAALRAFGRGKVIGPVIAPDADGAKALIGFFLAAHPGDFLRVDTTADTGLGPWLADCGLRHVGGGIAMRRPAPLPAPTDTTATPVMTYALASQALG